MNEHFSKLCAWEKAARAGVTPTTMPTPWGDVPVTSGEVDQFLQAIKAAVQESSTGPRPSRKINRAQARAARGRK